jgi:hypothetical protein
LALNRKYPVLLILLLNCLIVFPQDEKWGTIIINNIFSFDGEIRMSGSWPFDVEFKLPGHDDFQTVKAGVASHLIVNNTDSYRALQVEMKNGDKEYIFAEVLSSGKTTLFKLTHGIHRFKIYEDDLITLTRNNYREVINNLAGPCDASWCSWQRTIFSEKSLRFFFHNYNQGTLQKRFPILNAGLKLQYNQWVINFPDFNSIGSFRKIPGYKYRKSYFSPVLFLHIPSYLSEDLGVDLQISHHSFLNTGTIDQASNLGFIQDYLMNFSYLNSLVALRYSMKWNRLEPFISIGAAIMIPTLFEGKLAQFQISNNVYSQIYSENFFPKPGVLPGFNLNQGIQYNIFHRTILAADWGYARYFNLNSSGYQFSNFYVGLSLNFWPW